MTEFDIYKEYLINVAKKEGRPFRLPKDESKFIERPDYTLFYGLMKELEKKDIKSLKDMKEFMSNASSMNYATVVCYGFEEAKKEINNYLHDF